MTTPLNPPDITPPDITPPRPSETIGSPPPRKHHRVRWTLLTILAVFIALIAIGLAGTRRPAAVAPAASPPASSQPAATAPATPAVSTPANLTGPLGTTYVDSGTVAATGAAFSYNVTAVRITDPAYGANEFDTPAAGDRFVGVEFTVTGVSGYSTYDSNIAASLTGSDGQVYQADFDTITAGTNFNSGDFGVTAGQSETGWVTFQVPSGVSVASVQWQPDIGSQPAIWTNS